MKDDFQNGKEVSNNTSNFFYSKRPEGLPKQGNEQRKDNQARNEVNAWLSWYNKF